MIGWILYLHETIDLQFWQEFFNTQLKMKGHEEDMVGLSVRKPLDGTKSNAGLETQKQIKTIHVETKGDISDSIKNDLKSILKGTAIKKFYHSELRLIPPYDFRQQTTHYNSKVKSCIVSHEQYTAQISMGDFDIDTVDRSLAAQDNATMRELILRIKHSNGSPLFVGVEKKWNGQGYSVLYPTVFRKEAMEYVKHLPFYLVRLYGKDIKRQFSARIQQEISSTVWNEEEKRAFSAEDMDLKDAQSAHESMTWFTFDPSLSLNTVDQNLSSDTALTESLNDDEDHYQIEQRSEVSSFATTTSNSMKRSIRKDTSLIGDQDEISAVTTGTYDTRMTNLESQMDDIQVSLEQKLEKSTQDIQQSIQLQIQNSMQSFINQMKDIQTSNMQIMTEGTTTTKESPSSQSAGSKRRSTEEDKVKKISRKNKTSTRFVTRETEEKVQSIKTRSASQLEIAADSNLKRQILKPGEVEASPGGT